MTQDQIDNLNNQAWESRISDSLEAGKIAQEALGVATKEGYRKGIADANRILGFCLIRLSKHKEAYVCLEAAKHIYEEIKDTQGAAPLYEYFGIINRAWGDFQSALENINHAIVLSQETGFDENEMTNHYQLGVTYRALGEYDQALESLDQSLTIAKRLNHDLMKGYVINVMGSIYYKTENYNKALEYYREGLKLRQSSGDKWGIAGSLDNVGMTQMQLGELQKATDSCNSSLLINREIGDRKGEANSLMLLAQIHEQRREFDKALIHAEQCQSIRADLRDKKGEAEIIVQMAKIQRKAATNQEFDEDYLDKALAIVNEISAKDLKSVIYQEYYLNFKRTKQFEKSIEYLEYFLDNEKSLHKDAIEQKIKNLEISHKVEESKKETEIFRLKNVELSELYKKSEQQRSEIQIQKEKLEKAMEQLKSTQDQLIHSEKMASLGELTAGIAHEIQNPLNFVNNFSEVSGEMVDEAMEEITSTALGDLTEDDIDEIKQLLDDVKSNLEKITHHGHRASSIVKGMLQHSRSSSGEKELTDINALCDEYLRLSFHGLRAKDRSFNAHYETDFDDNIPQVKIVPQEIGRVVLNLINNAFQAVDEKYKSGIVGYTPKVIVTTQLSRLRGPGGRKDQYPFVKVLIEDNGPGIPDKIKDKIFQPFFTTKPTGQGTGLGLSLSYDIVTKGHGGKLEVSTESGRGATFAITLPVESNT